MKNGKLGGLIVALLLVIGIPSLFLCIERIPEGYVGVVYSPKDGVEDELLGRGWNFVTPWKKVKQFTIGSEQIVLTKDEREGSEEDESFNVTTADDATIPVSFEMTYHFEETSVLPTYKKFKGMDGEAIVERRVLNVLKAKVSEVTTTHTLMDIYSGDRAKINQEITDHLNEEFLKDYGIVVDSASIIDVHPGKTLKEAINARVKATQEKQQAEVEQEKVKVEAETAKIKAQNEADIKILEAEAEAKANKAIAESISQELIDMEIAEARKKHGWVEITGIDSTVVKEK